LTNLNYENPRHISAGCGNLEARKRFVEKRDALNNAKKYGVTLFIVTAQSSNL